MSGLRGIAFAIFMTLLTALARAEGRDQDDIKRLRDAGDILPLRTIMQQWRERQAGGRLLEAELEREDDRYVYELVILGDDGVVRELQYDASTGEFLGMEGEH